MTPRVSSLQVGTAYLNARKAQFGAQLRFFRQLVTAAKVPHVADLAKQHLTASNCVVIGLQSTGWDSSLQLAPVA